ncbi:hypothetical protein [Microcoleus sp. B4-D4]|uniref:hypothetical protein n=1 Tax=Microcoleus sp. B4-D4 TaxID=2818667 RepID=UPI002FD2D477
MSNNQLVQTTTIALDNECLNYDSIFPKDDTGYVVTPADLPHVFIYKERLDLTKLDFNRVPHDQIESVTIFAFCIDIPYLSENCSDPILVSDLLFLNAHYEIRQKISIPVHRRLCIISQSIRNNFENPNWNIEVKSFVKNIEKNAQVCPFIQTPEGSDCQIIAIHDSKPKVYRIRSISKDNWTSKLLFPYPSPRLFDRWENNSDQDNDELQLLHKQALIDSIDGFEISLSTCLILANSFSKDARSAAKKYVQWVLDILPQSNKNIGDIDIIRMSELAALSSELVVMLDTPYTPVPYCSPAVYKEYLNLIKEQATLVQSKVRGLISQQNTSNLLDGLKKLSLNIEQNGDALLAFIKATADYQEAMAANYEKNKSLAQEDVRKLTVEKNNLLNKITTQGENFQKALENFKKDAEKDAERQAIMAFVSLTATVLSGGATSVDSFSKLTEAASKVSAAAEALQRIAKFAQNIARLSVALKLSSEAIKLTLEIIKFPKDFDSSKLNTLKKELSKVKGNIKENKMPTKLEWDVMLVDIKTVLGNINLAASSRNTAIGEFEKLALQSKTYLETEAQIVRMEKEIAESERLKVAAKNQKEALNKISINSLTLEVGRDWSWLICQAQLIERKLLLMFIRAFNLLDSAMQYEFLQASNAEKASNLELINLTELLINQQERMQAALTSQAMKPKSLKPIKYKVWVAPEKVTHGNSFTFDIPLDAKEFKEYVRVRVKNVDVAFEKSINTSTTVHIDTSSGKYILEWKFNGNPFYDRDFNRQTKAFSMMSCRGINEYISDVRESSDESVTYESGWSSYDPLVSQITPFSQWSVNFPEVSTNEEINFKMIEICTDRKGKEHINITDSVEQICIVLTFDVEAFIVDEKLKTQLNSLKLL